MWAATNGTAGIPLVSNLVSNSVSKSVSSHAANPRPLDSGLYKNGREAPQP